MALFPAFAGLACKKVDESPKELEWLTNQSFCSDEALSLHQRAVEKASEPRTQPAEPGLLTSEEEEEDSNNVLPKKRKTKKEKKKKKKKKKHRRRSSGSESDTVYPSDLLRKTKEEEPGQEPQAQMEGRFMWLDDVQSSAARPFCLDRKADPANWEYKSLYRGDVARYRRKGASSLGLDHRRQALDWAESELSGRKRSDRNRKQTDRYFSSSARPLLRAPPTPSLPGAAAAPGSTASFIPLPPSAAEGGGGGAPGAALTWVNPLGVYDDSTALWLQGRGQAEQGRGPEPSRDRDAGAALLADRVEDFNKRLRETPTDTQLWLQFLHFQDTLWEAGGAAFGGEGGGGEVDRGGQLGRASLERKLCIAERAVESNPGCVALQLERLRLSRELWEPAKLQKEWRKLVFLHPNSAPLWQEYLLFTQSHFSAFSVSKVNAAYGKCLSTLAAVQDGTMTSHPALPGTLESMLDIFVQQCHFLRQAGHSEKSISLFQALLDFTFFKPDSVKDLPTRQQVEFFEPFWDSGEPRVGEHGARGWKAWMLQQERGGWLIPNTDEDDDDEDEDQEGELKDKTWPKWRIWLDVETSREANNWLPWRPDKAKGQSVEDCEDPDRQVLFDDIGSSLIRLIGPELQLHLVLHFLQFLGVPAWCSAAHSAPWWSLLLEDLALLGEEGPHAQPPLTAYHLPTSLVSPVGHMTTLQGARKWAGLGKRGEEFLTNVFQMLLPLLPSEQRAVLYLCWLQYEKLKVLRCVWSGNKRRLRVQAKRSKRVAKRLLKEPENRGRLALWREYAHLEWLLGNLADARKVFDSALTMGVTGGLADSALCHLCLLYTQLEVEAGAGQGAAGAAAVHVLTKLAEGGGYAAFSGELAPVAVLKARRAYELALDSCLASLDQGQDTGSLGQFNQPGLVSGLVGCHALFQYLTVGLEAAQAVYRQARERLDRLHASACQANANSDASQANANGDASQANANSDASHANANSGASHANSANSGANHANANSAEANWLASERESLAVQQAALLHHHTSASVFPLRPLRETLTSALQLHPASAPLWRLYAQVENRYHSAGRARRFYQSVSRGNACVVPRLFAISAEQRRKQLLDSVLRSGSHGDALPALPENGLSNRIRSLFENAIATEQGAHCPLLWRMYLHFLVSEGNVERARGIFYKALQDVPWAKGVYMDAVRLFPEHVQEYLDLMTEKELRLRLPMEEIDILLED